MEDPTVQMNKSLKVNSRDKALLVRTPFMSALSNEALLKMLNAAAISSLPARHVVFREGTPADHFYCVLGGYVRLYRLNREGREADIRVCGPGDTFAECQIFGDDTYRFNAQTAENTTFARFDTRTVRTLAEQEPDIAKAIMACLSQHLLTTMDCVANDRLHTAQQRVAEYLLKNCPVSGGPRSACPSRRTCSPACWVWRPRPCRGPSPRFAASASPSAAASCRSVTSGPCGTSSQQPQRPPFSFRKRTT